MLGILKLIRIIKSQSCKTKFLILTLPFLVCFAAVLIRWITKYSFPIKRDAATLYLIDYNFYYGTRIFIGSIYTALMKHISDDFIFAVNLTAYIVCVLLFLRCLMVYFRKAEETYNVTLTALIPCFLMCPYSILQFSGWVGSYDIWLCLAMIVSCLAAGNKAARWFIPVISVCAVFTHYAFVFSFFPAIACVQLFMIFRKNSGSRAGDIFSFLLTFALTFAAAVWCGFYAQSTIKMSENELFQYMSGRLGEQVTNWRYITSYYFESKDNIEMLGGLIETIDKEQFMRENIRYFLPFALLIAAIWIGCIIKSKRVTDRLKYLIFIGAFAVSSSVMFFIIEANRWRAAAVISQIVILCICLKENDEPVRCFFETVNKKRFAAIPLALALYGFQILTHNEPHDYY